MSRQILNEFRELNEQILGFYDKLGFSPNYSKVTREMLTETQVDQIDIELAKVELESLKKLALTQRNWKVISSA
jgi:hypothetical protein